MGKGNSCTYCATCQVFRDFSDQNVRPDNSSMHVEGSYGACECSKPQPVSIDDQYTGYLAACYG